MTGSKAQQATEALASAHPHDVELAKLDQAVERGIMTAREAITRAYMLGRSAGGASSTGIGGASGGTANASAGIASGVVGGAGGQGRL